MSIKILAEILLAFACVFYSSNIGEAAESQHLMKMNDLFELGWIPDSRTTAILVSRVQQPFPDMDSIFERTKSAPDISALTPKEQSLVYFCGSWGSCICKSLRGAQVSSLIFTDGTSSNEDQSVSIVSFVDQQSHLLSKLRKLSTDSENKLPVMCFAGTEDGQFVYAEILDDKHLAIANNIESVVATSDCHNRVGTNGPRPEVCRLSEQKLAHDDNEIWIFLDGRKHWKEEHSKTTNEAAAFTPAVWTLSIQNNRLNIAFEGEKVSKVAGLRSTFLDMPDFAGTIEDKVVNGKICGQIIKSKTKKDFSYIIFILAGMFHKISGC